ncbi:MAG: fasciclin domain-containing protein [Algicola sp.]|nr:fasciclin domain-containing protein [Algicola sp.]
MKTQLFKHLTISLALFFSVVSFGQSKMQKTLGAIDNTDQYKTIELVFMDKDLSIFANLITLSGLDTSLAFTDSEHTLFVPTNDAFTNMSIEEFAELTDPKNRSKLVTFVKNHFYSKKFNSYNLKNNDIIDLNDDKKIKLYSDANTIGIGGATVSESDIETANGIIHILDETIMITK